MSAIFFLIGCSVFIALIFLAAFFWANKTGQHEDTYTPSVRILFDDEVAQDTDCGPSNEHRQSAPAAREQTRS
ncbi:cbb3-type cytochrome oxidase assembly protein CcoS [Parapedobacter lycopersici]|uniref:cbb3-type cytochrome oxidase assembly protein CcoS n=1 Tax=Parapedobacter lycopersici TaxID=1864939 RepID=UPI00214DC126|nr:cbb3-type cytochrome oxidase assembly protein CcoS [Parapedobacter lycopersici]